MLKRILLSLLFLVFFIAPSKVFAVTVSINNFPSSVSTDPFDLNITVSGASEGQNYLRADLYKEGTSNYFGETFNGVSWYGGSEGKSYFPITIDSSKTATASMQVRIGTPSSSEFTSSGNYKLRIRRYTSSGNPASSDQQDPVNITVTFALPSSTLTPMPTPKSVPTQKSTPTTKQITSVSPTKIVNNPTLSSSKSTSIDSSLQGSSGPTAVLGDKASPQIIQKDSKDIKILGQSENRAPMILILIGVVLGIGCGILSYFKYFRKKKEDGI